MTNIVADQKASIVTKKGYTYSYNYADLASVLEAIRKPFSENGLAIVQGLEAEIGKITVTTQLCHTSGQWIRSQLSLFVDPNATPQEIGSAQSYARRYSLNGMVAVAAEDDDGKEASQSTKEKKATEKPAVDTETGEIKATATTAGQPKVTEQPTLCPIHKVAWKEGKEGSLYHGPKDPDWCTPAKAYRPNLEAAWAASGLQGKCDEWIAETYNKPWAKLAPGVCEHAVKKLTDHIEGKVLISFETKPDDAGRSRMQDYKKLESAAPKVPTDAMWNVWHELCQQADKLGITYAAVDEKTTSSTELAKQGRMLRALVEAKESQAKEGEEKEGKCT